ncbi:methylated-DNA--[protein]-cysteine S-methyltransferase [Peribacillus frigoritolerans]|uniref:methylated-DNA--[protein]-cysteine S-methyltransferase n=1 Tax=Peribacillus frigoritolerans TaxID=450367 RepID=UPI001059D7E1|nr:methylated-DNA--[protein]-cysteine S-methyltransferase [Peribacillus frigoritolerans]TDL80352.1 methylated-DNA--[protein]-cysteine S-methyltransferase [Peribacillus frigoritolerans]
MQMKGYYQSPIGWMEVIGSEKGISGVSFTDAAEKKSDCHPYIERCIQELDDYFKGEIPFFTVPIEAIGTVFQQKVWSEVNSIPFGQTASYSEIAERIGSPQASRAVGMANGKNKLGILIPCHRVLGKNSSLTGYAWETWRKQWLLNHEKKMLGKWNHLNIAKRNSELKS